MTELGSSVGDDVAVNRFVLQQGGDVVRFVAIVNMPNRSLALLIMDLVVVETCRTNQLR